MNQTSIKDTLFIVLVVFGLALFCGAAGTCKKWQYDECVNVGHDPTYCKAESAGCFEPAAKRR